MFIRPATRRDFDLIPPLIEAAFGQHDEALIVERLRDDGDIVFEFVATDRDVLIGHIVMSKLVSPKHCLALAPLSVHPDYQKRGIGSTLVRKATEVAEERGWTAAFVLGNPAYYGRFGYEVAEAQEFDTVYPSEFMAACVFDAAGFGAASRDLVYPAAF